MKTKAIHVLGALAVLSACQAKEEWGENKEQIRLSLAGDIEQLAVTRASANAFTEGDQVGIYAVNYDGDTPGTLALKGNQATNVRFTFDGTSTWTPDYDIYYKDKNTKVDIYGYYPYSSAISSVSEWPFEVQEDQSAVSAHGNMGGYEASDFLWAKREAVTPTANAIQLLFQHKMSCVVVNLVEGTGFGTGEFASLSKSVLINNVKRNALINLSTGVVTATGAIPSRSTVPADYEGGFRAIVVPQTVGSALTLFSITLGGTAYTYSYGSAFTYVAGKQHNFDVTVDKKGDDGYAVSVSTSISAWTNDNSSHNFTAKEYVVVNLETAGTLKQIVTESGANLESIRNLKLTGKINVNDFFFMRDELPNLAGVNIKDTRIEAAVGPAWYNDEFTEDYPEDAIPHYAFSDIYGNGKKSLTSFIFPEYLKIIETGAFYCTSLSGALIIPEGVTEIQGSAFKGSKITSVLFPSTLQTIGGGFLEGAFIDCKYLVGQLNLPSSLTSIGESSFNGCSGLTGALILPDGLEELGRSAFAGCSGLSGNLTFPTRITEVNASVFHGCRFGGMLFLHEGITKINADAFNECDFKGELFLPPSIQFIGTSAFSVNSFSSISGFPETLLTIEANAFARNYRLSGNIILPGELAFISDGIFDQCHNLEGIVIPEYVEIIGNNAFSECFQLNSIVCNSDTPPVVKNGAFNGVPKDNFAVEVPEASVNQYIYAEGWKEFKRITAHREFSISRNLYRTLNQNESRTFVIRAESGSDWSVESKPDWVTVTPSSGTGKVNVNVTVNALAGGAEDRSGEVVFLLNGKDYRSTLKVEQYDYGYADGDVINLQTHSKGNGIPIIFLGDCYDAKDIASGDYLTDTQAAISHFFDIEPYKTYQDYFDVSIVFGKSEDSGVGTVNTIREAKFGTQYSLTGGSLENDGTMAFQYAKKVDANMDLTKALVVMVLNSTDYGGVTYMWNDGSAIAICPRSTDPYPYDFRGLVQHEAGGHGFGKLADEYIYTNAFIQACACPYGHLDALLAGKANGWYMNLSETSDYDVVPWSHLIHHPSYSNTVDVYEGGFFHTRGVFRSEANSCMNNNIPYYSAISRQAIVERIMAYAGETFDLEDFYANDAAAVTKATGIVIPAWTPTPSASHTLQHHEPIIMGDHPTL